MKVKEKEKAVLLRKQGMSMGAIAKKLNVAKSSISYWVGDIELTQEQVCKLNKNGHSIAAIEKRRISRLRGTQKQREAIMEAAAAELPKRLKDPLWCIGVALYWGEGGKTQQTARLANSDPEIIKLTMTFFRQACNVPEDKFRGHVHTFSESNVKQAEEYWSKISVIPRHKFYKTYVKQSKASKKKRKTLPYGTFQIYVHDSNFFFRLMGWIQAMKNLELKS